MSEQMMTAQELAEAREFVAGMGGPCDCLICNHIGGLLPRLLATVDALTQRAERADGERDELQAALNKVRPMRETLLAECKRVADEFDILEAQRDEALALADARGRALDNLLPGVDEKWLTERQFTAGNVPFVSVGNTKENWLEALRVFHLPAPEALRQQQEREAEKDALIERLRGALRGAETSLPPVCGDDKCGHYTCGKRRDAERAISLTPPQALREREERVGALERVAEAAIEWSNSCVQMPPHSEEEREAWERFSDAVDALDAVKGER